VFDRIFPYLGILGVLTSRSSWKELLESPIICDNSEKSPGKAVLSRYRERKKDQTLTIFSLGNINLPEVLVHFPDIFLRAQCRIIKHENKIKVGCIPLPIGGKIKNVYIKQHNCVSFRHRLGSFFFPSAATRSLFAAAILLKAGHDTARPIAAMEYRIWGVLTKSLHLSEEISGAKTVDTYWREVLTPLKGVSGYLRRRDFIRSLARMFHSLHTQKIYHNDLKASNILARDGEEPAADLFNLVDLQGVRKCFYLSTRRKIKNLAQLNRTLGPLLSKTEKLFFLNAYGDSCFSNRRKKRNLVENILNETTRQIVREKWSSLRSAPVSRTTRELKISQSNRGYKGDH
jgi:tRNA A-37 threonylcarbamoyl transferase component Bud32